MRKALFILGQLSDEDVDWMTTVGHKEQVAPNTVLIQEGKQIEALYIVLSGLMSVTEAGLKGQELARLGAGEIVGEMSFIDASPPAATVTALQDSVVLSIPRSDLSARLEQDTGFAARFYRAIAIFLSSRLRATDTLLGYHYGEGQPLSKEARYADELDDSVLDTVYLAGARFERMLKQLMHD